MTTKTGSAGSASTQRRNEDASRAEQLAEGLSKRVTGAISTAVARTREEVEDIWAEARRIHNSKD